VTVDQDRAADRSFAVAAGGLMAAEVALGAMADAGVFALWVWCILAVMAIFVAAILARVGQRRVRRPPA
jgi:hypothetical protein